MRLEVVDERAEVLWAVPGSVDEDDGWQRHFERDERSREKLKLEECSSIYQLTARLGLLPAIGTASLASALAAQLLMIMLGATRVRKLYERLCSRLFSNGRSSDTGRFARV